MRIFFLFSLAYCAFSLAFATVAGLEPGLATQMILLRLKTALETVYPYATCAALVIGWFVWRGVPFGERLLAVLLATLGTAILMASFLTAKSAMPGVLPFRADALLADLDAALHLGNDPWRITHALAGGLPAGLVDLIYISLWSAVVLALPVAIAFDPDPDRQKRAIVLYLAAWVVCGNVLAAAGLSGGPVYSDVLSGGDRFAGLHDALARSGIADSNVGAIQALLWRAHESGEYALASGISAFPSVHVAIAMVFVLYLRSRWPGLAPAGWAFLGMIQFLSVHTGYHYAIDGYVSIAVIGSIWWLLWRRRAAVSVRLVHA